MREEEFLPAYPPVALVLGFERKGISVIILMSHYERFYLLYMGSSWPVSRDVHQFIVAPGDRTLVYLNKPSLIMSGLLLL